MGPKNRLGSVLGTGEGGGPDRSHKTVISRRESVYRWCLELESGSLVAFFMYIVHEGQRGGGEPAVTSRGEARSKAICHVMFRRGPALVGGDSRYLPNHVTYGESLAAADGQPGGAASYCDAWIQAGWRAQSWLRRSIEHFYPVLHVTLTHKATHIFTLHIHMRRSYGITRNPTHLDCSRRPAYARTHAFARARATSGYMHCAWMGWDGKLCVTLSTVPRPVPYRFRC